MRWPNIWASITSWMLMMAQMFGQRIVGLQLGEIVYDGPPNGLTSDVLTRIYGEEDWEATIETVDEDDDVDETTDQLIRESAEGE